MSPSKTGQRAKMHNTNTLNQLTWIFVSVNYNCAFPTFLTCQNVNEVYYLWQVS